MTVRVRRLHALATAGWMLSVCAPAGLAQPGQSPGPSTPPAATPPAAPPSQPAPTPTPAPAAPSPSETPTTSSVVLRGGEAAPGPIVTGISSLGVTVGGTIPGSTKAAPIAIVGWDRVKEVRGPLAEEARQHMGVADQVWRARRRLERDDAPAAEPLFEQVFSLYKGKPGPTSAVIAEGLLRCRLRRGAHILAIDPWLAMLAAQSRDPAAIALHKAEWAQDAGLAPVLDPATGLLPAVPPIWLGWESLRGFAAATDRPPVETKPGALMAYYQAAAAFELGSSVDLPRVNNQDPGVLLVSMVVRSRVGSVEQRSSARKQLEDRVRTASAPWMEAWARSALGRSLLMEDDPEQQRLGIIELLHLPARFSLTHPYLAGAALAEASVRLDKLGDADGARVLRRELTQEYANHPALLWPPVRDALSRDASFTPAKAPSSTANAAPGGSADAPPPPSPSSVPDTPPPR